MQRLYLLQGKLWPVIFGTLEAFYFSNFCNEPSAQLIIQRFLKTE